MAYEGRGDAPVKYPDTENSESPVKDLGLALELQLPVRKILLTLFQPRVSLITPLKVELSSTGSRKLCKYFQLVP